MQLTEEQKSIINSKGDIKINAVAGSGKTTTVIEYAKTRPAGSKILYLAFNKSVKLEAVKKFSDNNIHNVQVETAHSLAYRHIVMRSGFKIKTQGYKINEIVELLNLQGGDEKHTEYVIANYISKLISFFCNSDKPKVADLNFIETISDKKAKTFVATYYPYILKQARILLGKMYKGEIEITHDFYLKLFQLSNPDLHYDYILFDEGQDASAAMLDVFLNQKATKVIVGDTNQQIYSWRYAINSLEKANFKNFYLTTSFRFSPSIANLAKEILAFKSYIGEENDINIFGKGSTQVVKSNATIARTNLGLLLRAIEYITERKSVSNIYFEGNINSYTYADEGASLYDVLNLFNGEHAKIRDSLIKNMKDIEELEDYIEKTEDGQLSMMLEIVKEYGNEIPKLINKLKKKHVENDEKEKAEMVFSTVHRCKGMEYDSVYLVNDFITEEKLQKIEIDIEKGEEVNLAKINEEINLLYVAITRTKKLLYIPEKMLPIDFKKSVDIFVTVQATKEQKKELAKPTNSTHRKERKPRTERKPRAERNSEKTFSVDKFREKHKDAYRPWTSPQDSELSDMYYNSSSVAEMAEHFGRTRGAILARLAKVGLGDL